VALRTNGKRLVVERYLYGSGRAEAEPQALYVVAADESGHDPVTFGPGEVDQE
jgi:hypothetical protein